MRFQPSQTGLIPIKKRNEPYKLKTEKLKTLKWFIAIKRDLKLLAVITFCLRSEKSVHNFLSIAQPGTFLFFPAILHFPLHLFKFDFDRPHSIYIDFTINNQQLSPDGTFTKPANSKLLYGTMSLTRAGIVGDSFWDLSKAITIAIRYSAVRRQGQLKQGYGTSLLVLETICIPVINLSTPKSD